VKGIDISNYQGVINFAKVKASGVEIVYIKATEGLTVDNILFEAQYDGAKKAGLKIGVYHYLRDNNPVEEAEHFLSVVTGLPMDCKYAIDCETTLGQTIAEVSLNVVKFTDYLVSKGKQVCLYTGVNFYKESLNSTVKELPLWIACYEAKCPLTTYAGIQYSDVGVVAGITSKVDLNTFSDEMLISIPKPVAKPIIKPVIKPVVVAKPKINEKVLALQTLLNNQGFTDDKGKKLTEDGITGPCTVQAVGKLSKSL
jgi:lysozyme